MATGCNEVFLGNQKLSLSSGVDGMSDVTKPSIITRQAMREQWAESGHRSSHSPCCLTQTIQNASWLLPILSFFFDGFTSLQAARYQDQLTSKSFLSAKVVRMQPEPNGLLHYLVMRPAILASPAGRSKVVCTGIWPLGGPEL
jgi:hypothetical protein